MTITAKFDSRCVACGCSIKAGSVIEWTKGVGARHMTVAECTTAQHERAAAGMTGKVLNLKSIVDFLMAARARGLKSPRLRVLAPDGRSEMRVSITKQGMAPGSLAVVIAGAYVGAVRPDGAVVRLTDEVQRTLLAVAENPVNAAREYAALMGLCSFCGLPLTDAGSVEVGYGPICAKKWGLPHHPKGTPHVQQPVGQGSLI